MAAELRVGEYDVSVDGGDTQITVSWTDSHGRMQEQWVWLSFPQLERLYAAARASLDAA